jgi:hypothetical protein
MNWTKNILKGRANQKKEIVDKKPNPSSFSEHTTVIIAESGDWYPPVILNPSTVAAMATSSNCLQQVMQVVRQLESDDYVEYLLAYYQAGQKRFGEYWCYSDIVTVLLSAAQLIRPQNYLEI